MRLNHYRAGNGGPLVLIHGIGSRWQMWEPVIDRLVAEREVIAIDLPGFGASPMPPVGTPAGVDSLVSLVLEFLSEIGVERPHSAGNSLGGLIVLELAKRGLVRSATASPPRASPTSRRPGAPLLALDRSPRSSAFGAACRRAARLPHRPPARTRHVRRPAGADLAR
jgi:pimeloyl-ACP methyl ester carboxylesterase